MIDSRLFEALQQEYVSVVTEKENRIYYDDKGKVVCYSHEQKDYRYIVVDDKTYAERRQDIKIVNEKITRPNSGSYKKLIPSEEGITCSYDDVSIISEEGQNWSLISYE